MSVDTSCPICTLDDCETVAETNSYRLRRCSECGLIVKVYNGTDRVDLQAKRDDVYTEAALKARLRNLLFSEIATERLAYLCEIKRQGKLLEIGCATGEFIEAAEKIGYNVSAVDSSPIFCEYLRNRGVDVQYGDFDTISLPAASYDVIAGFHLLEHIPDPRHFLNRVSSLLHPDGLLYLVTPNTASRTDLLFGWEHPLYAEPDHICLYTPETVSRLLEEQGYEILRLETWEPAHHLFTSLKIFLKQSRSNVRQILGKFIKPYFLTSLLGCWVRHRATRLRRLRVGHEIVVIARKL